MKSQSHQQMPPNQQKDMPAAAAAAGDDKTNKENKVTLLQPTDSVERKEFDKMLKNIYVKQGYNSVGSY